MKLSDYVVQYLIDSGIKETFLISGGGIIHLVESIGSNPNMKYYCNHNEQATAYCAEGYARAKNGLSAVFVTTGPGSTNALSGVCGAFVDSVPMLIISGQVKKELIADYSKLRQIGEQEINIIDMVKPVTKYAVTVNNPEEIKYHLDKAVHCATTGRPGPVWINIPLDVQGSCIDENKLHGYCEKTTEKDAAYLTEKVKEALVILKNAKRPVLLCGYGVRIAKAQDLLHRLLDTIALPTLLSFNGMDILEEEHPLFFGKPGIIGQRRANFVLQNADCVLVIGSRANLKIVGYNYKDVAKQAKKIMVNNDRHELEKHTFVPDLPILADAFDFITELLRQLEINTIAIDKKWLAYCRSMKQKYPSIINDFYKDKNYVNSYVFYDMLSDLASAEDIVVSSNGMSALNLYQAYKPKKNQVVFTNNGYGAMGYGLPAAIGACVYNQKKRTICIEGDGSLNMNMQELQLLSHYKLPVKLFVLNNYGYSSIRMTQDGLFNSHYVASDVSSGVSNPEYEGLAKAFSIPYVKIMNNEEIHSKIKEVLDIKGPVFCDVSISPKQEIVPKTKSYKKEDGSIASSALEDMYPFISREELKENMKISCE